MKFSVVIPARNEERYIGRGLEAIRAAAAFHGCDPEIVVVLNRCTDRTEEIARAAGAVITEMDGKNLARIRNAGVKAATGEVIITIDADSIMGRKTFAEVHRAISSGRYIGGGVPIRTERMSLGIFVCAVFILLLLVPRGISAGMFWCRKEDFEAIGGFDEKKFVAEDVDFAVRLRRYGRQTGRKFGTLWRTHIKTSCRKFDTYGDWLVLRLIARHPSLILRGFDVITKESADLMFYEYEHRRADPGVRDQSALEDGTA